MSGIRQYLSFCVWFLSLSIVFRLIHVVTCVRTSFLLKAESRGSVWMDHTVFSHHPWMDSWCFHLLAIVNRAVVQNLILNPSLNVLSRKHYLLCLGSGYRLYIGKEHRSCFFVFVFCLCCIFLTVLGLRCCACTFSSCGERGLLFVVVHGLLIVVASFVSEHGL